MGAQVHVIISYGRSECAICHKRILKGLKQITFNGWNASAIVHSDSNYCDIEKRI